jgi:hypothetical protein
VRKWSLEYKFLPEGLPSSEYFGYSVSVFDNRTAIGAWGNDYTSTSAGAVYTYTRLDDGEWYLNDILFPSSANTRYEWFGYTVLLYKDILAITGGAAHGSIKYDVGKVYTYSIVYDDSRYDGCRYEFIDILLPNEEEDNMHFGQSLSMRDDMLLIGAPGTSTTDTDIEEPNAGRLYIYELHISKEWIFIKSIDNPYPSVSTNFGCASAIYENYFIVSACNSSVTESGTVYLFKEKSDYLSDVIDFALVSSFKGDVLYVDPNAPHAADIKRQSNKFGVSVALSDNIIVMGSTGYAEEGPRSRPQIGAVYMYHQVVSRKITKNYIFTGLSDLQRFLIVFFVLGTLGVISAVGYVVNNNDEEKAKMILSSPFLLLASIFKGRAKAQGYSPTSDCSEHSSHYGDHVALSHRTFRDNDRDNSYGPTSIALDESVSRASGGKSLQ